MSPIDDALSLIKGATRDLVKACGGLTRCERICGFSDSSISRWTLSTYGDVIPIMAALVLEAECGVPWVTSAMAEVNGRRLGDASGGAAVSVSLQRLHAEADLAMSETGLEVQKAFEDGRVTPSEAEVMDRKAAKTEQKVREFRQGLAGFKVNVVEGGGR
ncbi:hypothetical protein M4J40_01405 [Pleomorphomonas sp. NRK JP5]|nr:hypothetical protein [Pleomorphomonas sp. JP5]